MENQEDIIQERGKKLIGILKKNEVWVIGFLILAVILGVYIRSMPMHDHGGKPGLWDITTDTWTLGPDLDPWLFSRYAGEIIEAGSLSKIDSMRNVPLGFDTSKETTLLPHMIAYTYRLSGGLLDNVEHATVIFPVIMFGFTILVFFLFVREIFVRKSGKSRVRANIISLISTFFMIVIPIFLSRTLAGIPEKESAGFFFMFLSLYLFLKAWKAINLKTSIILSILAGIATACMSLIWGGVMYIFVAVAVASLIAFILNKIHKKEFFIYTLWMLFSFALILNFSGRATLKNLIISLDTGLVFVIFFIMSIHFILWNTKLSKIKILQNRKLPQNILSLIVGVILLILLSSVFFGPSFMIDKMRDLNQIFFKPVTGRWNTTVAENRQPFFTEWGASFGPFIRNIPVLFWLFFIGSVVLFKKMFNKIKKKDAWVLTGLYVLFFFGLVFSRYSGTSIFNGENFISKLFYYGSAILLIGYLIAYYIRYRKEGHSGFEKIRYEYLLLFSLFALSLFTARSAVRLIMVLGPIAVIFVGYLIFVSIERFRMPGAETGKMFFGIFMILVLLLSLFVFWNFYTTVKIQAYNMIPSYYNQQWQKAMQWTRDNTDKDTTVFAHWWDYGYWVQSIGNRATVLDGGNAIKFWNYYMGRLVLTGDNEKDALEFLYNHNATHLLIDSSDIGKYGAFSSIGSDESYDRYSWIPIMVSETSQTRETANGEIRIYQGGSAIDEDVVYKDNGSEIFLPAGRAGIGGFFLENSQTNTSIKFSQPEAVFFYNSQQYKIPLRYLYFNGQLYDFESGLEGGISIIDRVLESGQGVQIDRLGALIYISPRVLRGMLAQEYLLNDALGNFPNFEIAHVEQNLIIESLNAQGLNLGEFVYYQGLQGPIKIWDIHYTGEEEYREDYLDKDSSKYLDWAL